MGETRWFSLSQRADIKGGTRGSAGAGRRAKGGKGGAGKVSYRTRITFTHSTVIYSNH